MCQRVYKLFIFEQRKSFDHHLHFGGYVIAMLSHSIFYRKQQKNNILAHFEGKNPRNCLSPSVGWPSLRVNTVWFSFHPSVDIPRTFFFAGYEIWQMTMTQSGPTTLFSWAGLHFLFVFPWRSHFSPGVLIFGSIFDLWNLINASTECAWWVYILCHRRCGIPLTLLSIFVGLPLSSVEYKSL